MKNRAKTARNVLNVDKAAKNFNILATSLNVLHNYFDNSNRITFNI